jgi:hypothetical protein
MANPLPLFCQTTQKAATGTWETVKLVAVGSELVVKLKDGKTIKGRQAGATDAAITVSRKNRLQELERSTISRVSIIVKADKDKAQAIGAGTGAVVLTLSSLGGLTEVESGEAVWYLITVALIGAGIGYLIGSLIGVPRKSVLIYSATS